MKQVFTGSYFNRGALEEKEIVILESEETKYVAASDDCKKYTYTGLAKWTILTGEEADDFEDYLDESLFDEHHEYLLLTFAEGYFPMTDQHAGLGNTLVFKNSHVDMFVR